MKPTMTKLKGHNEPLVFFDLIFGNFFLETDAWCYHEQPSPIPPNTQLELLQFSLLGASETCNISVHNSSNSSNSSIRSSLVAYNAWTLYFDSSKMQDSSIVCCVLIDPTIRIICFHFVWSLCAPITLLNTKNS